MLTSLLNVLLLADVLFVYKCTGTLNGVTGEPGTCACYTAEPITDETAAWNAAVQYLNTHDKGYVAGITWSSVTPWVADMVVGGVTNSFVFGYHCEYKTDARKNAGTMMNCVDFCYGSRWYVCDVQEVIDGGVNYATAVSEIVKETVFMQFTNAVTAVSSEEADQIIANATGSPVNYAFRLTLNGTSDVSSTPVFLNPRLVPGFAQASSVSREPTVFRRAIDKIKNWWQR